MTGAGFLPRGKVVRKSSGFVLRLKRIRSLPDTVGPNMQVLIIGLNPSPYSADTGIGYGRPGNRFWPAALKAGLVSIDRDPRLAPTKLNALNSKPVLRELNDWQPG